MRLTFFFFLLFFKGHLYKVAFKNKSISQLKEISDSTALMLGSHCFLCVCHVPAHIHSSSSSFLGANKPLALLPGKLSAGSLLAWLLPFSHTWISSEESSLSHPLDLVLGDKAAQSFCHCQSYRSSLRRPPAP